LDSTGDTQSYLPSHDSMVAKFHHNGSPILILPSSFVVNVPYDDIQGII
jgi:hypothetical protein